MLSVSKKLPPTISRLLDAFPFHKSDPTCDGVLHSSGDAEMWCQKSATDAKKYIEAYPGRNWTWNPPDGFELGDNVSAFCPATCAAAGVFKDGC